MDREEEYALNFGVMVSFYDVYKTRRSMGKDTL